MSLKQKSNLTIEMISNGVVVSCMNVGEWQTTKKFFETRDDALRWIIEELNNEFSWNVNEAVVETKSTTSSTELPF